MSLIISIGYLLSVGSTLGLSAVSDSAKTFFMPLAMIALRKGIEVEVHVLIAKQLNRNDRRDLVCLECRERVVPHRESYDGSQAAHYEHFRRNDNCSLSDHRV